MTSRERFLAAMQNKVPDRVPVTPDISTMIPAKRAGVPFWDMFFHEKVSFQTAFLEAADYFGLDCWTAGHMWANLKWEASRVEYRRENSFDKKNDAAIRRTTIRTPDGDMTREEICFRFDPPSPTEKPIKNFEKDWKKFRWTLLSMPIGIDREKIEQQRRECHRRGHAFGLGVGYPGFQSWMVHVQGGVEPLAYAEMDHPEILQEWFELDMARGEKELEQILSVKPEYVFFGGSGTITLASPELAMKYAIPALKKGTKMCRDAGVLSLVHSCGKNRILVDMLVEHTDMNCINPLETPPMGDIDLAEVKKARGKQIALMGNLHTTDVMLRGTPQDVERACIKAMRDAGKGGGFILSTGDQCPRDTPEANIFAMVEAARKYGVYDQETGTLPNLPRGGSTAREMTNRLRVVRSRTRGGKMSGKHEPASVLKQLTRRVAELEKGGGGTLELGDGVYNINGPLRLPACVSLDMTPHAVIRALPKFKGKAVVIKDAGPKCVHQPCGWIRGGVIDGNRQPVTGLRIEHACRLEITELEVRDATHKGIHAANGWYEVNMSHVRCNVDLHTPYAPGSVGIHYDNCGDSLVQGATIIGYETGLRSDSWANDFSQVHMWNADPEQGPMKYCVYANGIFDAYNQCYADSPTKAGFYVTKPFNRVIACRIYYSRWAKNHAGAGVLVAPGGAHGTFAGNCFLWNKGHVLAHRYAGDLSSASIIGDNAGVMMMFRQPSLPRNARTGELAWLWPGDGVKAALYVRTPKGWDKVGRGK